jgi:tRNA (guanine6-N2)-methyltransferase
VKGAKGGAPAGYALTVPGLEDLASTELQRAGANITAVLKGFDKRDSIVVFTAPDVARVLRCGTIEDVFHTLLDAPTPSGNAAPKRLAELIDRASFERALAVHHAARPKKGGRSYKVVARVAGRHPFRREDVQHAFERAMARLLPRWTPATEMAAVELWVQVIGERTLVGLRVSGDELAARRYKRAHLPASLKPTVARALVLLSDPRPDDVVIDPMCGAGTLLRERADAGRAELALGGDVDAGALAAARVNAGRKPTLAQWDATRLPLHDRCVDVVITNPPYGRQHEALLGIERLYARAMREAARVLRPDGRCVVLTGEPDVLLRALPPPLRVTSRRRILLRGLSVTAFVMVRA